MTAVHDARLDLGGHTVLVTGAAGGIGRETARLCGAAGARLILSDIAPVGATEQACAGVAGIAQVHQCDGSRREEVAKLQAAAGPVHAVADTAGICPRDDWMAEDWDAVFDRVIDVNLRGPINLARAFMPGMIERGYGRLAFCGSIAGWTGGLRASPHYAASKGGLHALIRWFALRATPHGVCVNGVAPGPVESGMTAGGGYAPEQYPLKRMGRPEEIASLLAFLCSPAASYVCGAIIDANGGILMR